MTTRTIQSALPTLTADQQRLLTLAINTFGSGAHPAPDATTLPYFAAAYAVKCLRRAGQSSHVPAADRDAAMDLVALLA